MRNYFLRLLVGWAVMLPVSCTAPPAAFQPGTEFGSHLSSDLNPQHGQSTRIKMTVDYPEEFRGSVIEAIASSDAGPTNVLTLTLNSLEREGTRLCVHGEIAAIANSRGVRGFDDGGTQLTVENYVPQTTTMITSQLCTGQAEQQTCMPMTVPVTTAGDPSMLVKAKAAHGIKLRRNSLLVLRLTDGLCPSDGQAR